MTTTTHSGPNHPGSNHPGSDREALSALFDGELVGDAARFALKRLDHDQDWRATCERWQCVGDVLRSRNTPWPATFPSRVRAEVHADSRLQHAMPGAARTGGLRWGSVALAASAAVVAFFLARSPIGGPDAPAAPAQVASSNAAAPAPAQPAPSQPAPAPGAGLDTATAAVAVAAIARPVQRNRNLQRDRAATDRIVSSLISQSPVTAEAAPAPVLQDVAAEIALDANAIDAPAASPFGAANADPARPWPRAVLPQYRSNGALAADYATAPSFYPFVPTTQGTPQDSTTPPADSTRSAPAGGATPSQSPAQSPPPPLP